MLSKFDVDYNVWGNSGVFVRESVLDFNSYQKLFPTAKHDLCYYPDFMDTSEIKSHLRLKRSNAGTASCPLYKGVALDKDGTTRLAATTRGCYISDPDSLNASIVAVLGWERVNVSTGDTLQPYIIIQNTGINNINNIDVGWDVNNIYQGSIKWSGNLQTGEKDTISIGNYICKLNYGRNVLKVYFSSVESSTDNFSNDDTLSVENWICSKPMSGTFTIGDTGTFKSLEEALNSLSRCGFGGKVTFAFIPGIYEISETISYIAGMSDSNKITLTSLTGDSCDVILRETNLSPGALVIKGGCYIEISHLTIEGKYNNAIRITDESRHIKVHNCRIRTPKLNIPDTRQYRCVRISGGNNLIFYQNFLDGGAYGFDIEGMPMSTSRPSNIQIYENIINDVDYVGCDMEYADSVIFNNNLIRQRRGNFVLANMIAIYTRYANANIENNVLDIVKAQICIDLNYFGDTLSGYCRIVNNEIRGDSVSVGICCSYTSAVKIFHNSVFVKGSKALLINGNLSYGNIQNNIFHIQSNDNVESYPVYITSNIDNVYINNNCYYNGELTDVINYKNRYVTSLSQWMELVKTDSNSVFVAPNYIDASLNLQLKSSNNIECLTLRESLTDIEGKQRDSLYTNMGAYHVDIYPSDIAVIEIISPSAAEFIGDSIDLMVVVKNTGKSILNSVKIACQINGVTSPVYQWIGNLPVRVMDTIKIGKFVPISGKNTISFFAFEPNGVNKANTSDDTLKKSFFVCDTALSGKYYVGGSNAHFSDMDEALVAITNCGVSSAVELIVADGRYSGWIITDSIPGSNLENTVTFRSISGNADSVVVFDNKALILKNTSHLIFENISFNGDKTAVDMQEMIEDVTFRHCNISVPSNNEDNTCIAIKYSNISNADFNLFQLIGNRIDGGYSNLSFTITGNCNQYNYESGIIIDSNIFSNAFANGIVSRVSNIRSISHNTIRNKYMSKDYSAIYIEGSICGLIEGNRINLDNKGNSYGIKLINSGWYDTTLVCNNEIIIRDTGISVVSSTKYGVYFERMRGVLRFIHNSIYTNSTLLSYGTYFMPSAYQHEVYNNLIINGNNNGFALNISNAVSQVLRNYNNYFSYGGNIAFLNGIGSLKSIDSIGEPNSTSIAPVWKDDSDSLLQLSNDNTFICPTLSNICPYDLNGIERASKTRLGCYTCETDNKDAALTAFVIEPMISSVVSPVSVVIQNEGYTAIDSARIYIYIDNVLQKGWFYNPTVSLLYMQKDTVYLDSYQLGEGLHEFMAIVHLYGDTNNMNDTIRLIQMVCKQTVKGTVVIGNSSNADYLFSAIDTLFSTIRNCGVTGDVTLMFESGNYQGSLDLSLLSEAMGEYKLTITSQCGHRDSVLIYGTDTLITVGESNCNVVIKDLTLQNISNGASCVIYLKSGCEKINIENNCLIADTTSSNLSNNVIYNPSTGFVKHVYIKGNHIIGGNYGIRLLGAASNRTNIDICIDSNVLVKQNTAITVSNSLIKHISYNRIEARIVQASSTFTGMLIQNCNVDNITGNYIDASTNLKISNFRIMHISGLNISGCAYNSLIANNAIKVKTNNNPQIVNISNSKADFYHNTVYVSGTGSGTGFRVSNCIENIFIKGNLFVVSKSVLPLEIAASNSVIFDYNDIYNEGGDYLCVLNGKYHKTIAELQTAGLFHSVSVCPDFEDIDKSLRIKAHGKLFMPRLNEIPEDIDRVPRNTYTHIGAYEPLLDTLDASLCDFSNPKLDANGSTVYVTLSNVGYDSLLSADIEWEANGVRQTPVSWKGKLMQGEYAEVALGKYNAISYINNNLKAWVHNPNNKKDADCSNDTAVYDEYICTGAIKSGTYTVGGIGADFVSVDAMKEALYQCGVAGPVVMKIAAGNYEPLFFDVDV